QPGVHGSRGRGSSRRGRPTGNTLPGASRLHRQAAGCPARDAATALQRWLADRSDCQTGRSDHRGGLSSAEPHPASAARMRQPDAGAGEMNMKPSKDWRDELPILCEAVIEAVATPDLLRRLEELVLADAEARRFYVEYLHQHGSLQWSN